MCRVYQVKVVIHGVQTRHYSKLGQTRETVRNITYGNNQINVSVLGPLSVLKEQALHHLCTISAPSLALGLRNVPIRCLFRATSSGKKASVQF